MLNQKRQNKTKSNTNITFTFQQINFFYSICELGLRHMIVWHLVSYLLVLLVLWCIVIMSKLVIVARIIWHIISNRNKKITNSDNEANGKTCNCRNKSNCPLDNNCLTDKIVDKVEVETNDDINELYTKVYFGISEAEFKFR